MLKQERQNYISKAVNNLGKIKISQISQQLDVSRETIRKDIYELDSKNKLHMVRGGAEALPVKDKSNFIQKKLRNQSLKKEIANTAIKLIHDKDSVFLDAGTTSLEIARALNKSNLKDVTVVTNSTFVGEALQFTSKIHLVILGGTVRAGEGSLYGPITLSAMQNMFINLGFFGAAGIDPKFGITNPFLEEAQCSQQIMHHCQTAIVVADHTKFFKKSLVKMFDSSDVDLIITDSKTDFVKTKKAFPNIMNKRTIDKMKDDTK